ncbi:diguanylate cyclase [Niveibacterium umoris]|uniref:Diguanylate cyclase (GGDEF)-like protein/PAS domain S-box-containing protein n=1 Tax=Niveibacterium umoris TaxID=1193620 RepID=A0A840BRP3_9RHOO|nr:diguanylate cyclase (GGDEF)-like protein/PAS domain S-box-containing protein [Niveibacterium umoris]
MLLIGVFAGLLVAAASMPYVLKLEAEEAGGEVQRLLDAIEDTVSSACFVNDSELARQALSGILRGGTISSASILANGHVMATVGTRPPVSKSVVRAVRSPFFQAETVCEIRVETSEQMLRARVYEATGQTLAFMAMQGAIVALAAMAGVALFVTRPIQRISGALHGISRGKDGVIVVPKGHDDDEIGQLVADTNGMIESLTRAAAIERGLREQRERDEQRLRMIFENAETGLFTLDAEGRMQSWNPACVRVLGGPLHHDEHPSLEDLLPPLATQISAMRQRCGERERSVSEDLEISDESGLQRWIQLVLTPSGGGTLQGLANDISDRKRAEEAARELAVTDSLTGVLNRLGFNRRLADLVSEHARDRRHGFSLAMIDLDWFKQVNDTHGHDAGDHVLRVVAKRLEGLVRRTDTVARLGGDEFVVLLDGVIDEAAALTILHKVRQAVLEPISLETGAIAHVGASIGLTVVSETLCGPEEVMRRADAAMYAVKKASRNDVQLFGAQGAPSAGAAPSLPGATAERASG